MHLPILLSTFALARTPVGIEGAPPPAPGDDDLCPPIARRGSLLISDEEKTLNVHLVPHTHDDTGWLKTVGQYYYGLNETIQKAHVEKILDSVLLALSNNDGKHERTFTYVETKFLYMWYEKLDETRRQALKDLVESKQFTFTNGGWCMHDEAPTHFMGMIDQTTLGHSFLKNEFNVTPSVGWQIDPFGHSSTQGGLLTSGFGFDAIYFGRIHHVDLARRKESAECEGLWGNAIKGEQPVFWGLTGSYSGNYGAPEGFCFDKLCGDAAKYLVGQSEKYLLNRTMALMESIQKQAEETKGRNIMLTMGMDFQYENAGTNFANMDILIDSVDKYTSDGTIDIKDKFGGRFERVKIFYSSPERYTRCKYVDLISAKTHPEHESGSPAPDQKHNPSAWTDSVKVGDFFPYADNEHSYWAGYFSSRQSLKKMERVSSSFLHSARQIEALAKLFPSKISAKTETVSDSWSGSPLFSLDDAVGVAQHHDVATCKQHVAYDYAKSLAMGLQDASLFVSGVFRKLLLVPGLSALQNLRWCPLLNETICDVSQTASGNENQILYIVAYNALGTPRSEAIAIPIDAKDHPFTVEVLDETVTWKAVDSAILPNRNYLQNPVAAPNSIMFTATIPPVGLNIYRIRRSQSKNSLRLTPSVGRKLQQGPTSFDAQSDRVKSNREIKRGDVFSNGIMKVEFDESTGMIKRIKGENSSIEVTQEYGVYNAAAHGGDGFQNAGAYIMRPQPDDQAFHPLPVGNASVALYQSNVVTEVHATIGWVHQITRLVKGKDYIEIEYTVGPIPIEDGIGKEVVSRYTTSIQNTDGKFFTDSNGREFVPRRRNDLGVLGYESGLTLTEPVAQNYFPVNTAIFLEDEKSSFGVLVDRSQAGSSLAEGSLELLIQRRLLYDDARGVGEPLNETTDGITPDPPYGNTERLGEGVIIKGVHRLVIGGGKSGAPIVRSQMDHMFSQPLVFVGSEESAVQFSRSSLSLINHNSLPKNVMVITFNALAGDGSFLIRLGHQYGENEDNIYSNPARVDLQDLFTWSVISSVVEMNLSANQRLDEWEARRYRWSKETQPKNSLEGTVCLLQPLEIRTFVVTI